MTLIKKWSLDTIVTVSYIGANGTALIILSLIGAKMVSNAENNIELSNSNEKEKEITDRKMNEDNDTNIEITNITRPPNHINNTPSTTNTTCNHLKEFIKLWIKTVWKLRSIYASVLFHFFDILTDILVIIQWWYEEKTNGEINDLDTQLLAKSSVVVLLFHKLMSTFVIFYSERDIRRAVFQFFDLLLLEEVFLAHFNIFGSSSKSSNLSNSKQSNIDSTMTFKFLRSMEAIYESAPQAVLQLVYVMRRGKASYIFVISIVQSIISMTNAILKDDNSRGMQGSIWKSYKKRLPPTKEFFQHAISRLAQVVTRIGIFSLLWVVCGGGVFSLILGFEMLSVLVQFMMQGTDELNGECNLSLQDLLLFLNSTILLPCELMFVRENDNPFKKWLSFQGCDDATYCDSATCIIGNVLCCLGCGTILTHSCNACMVCCSIANGKELGATKIRTYIWPVARAGVSFVELMIILVFGIFGKDNNDNNDNNNNFNNKNYLFEWSHGLIMFSVCIFGFVITLTQSFLFPNFAMPDRIHPRSKWGLAFSGELIAMRRINTNIKHNIERSQIVDLLIGQRLGKEKTAKQERDAIQKEKEKISREKAITKAKARLGQQSKTKKTNKSEVTETTHELELELELQRQLNNRKCDWLPKCTCDFKTLISNCNYDNCICFFHVMYGLKARNIKSNKNLKNQLMDKETKKQLKLAKKEEIAQFWDEPTKDHQLTCAMLALANKQYKTVKWLEKHGAKTHLEFATDYETVRQAMPSYLPVGVAQ